MHAWRAVRELLPARHTATRLEAHRGRSWGIRRRPCAEFLISKHGHPGVSARDARAELRKQAAPQEQADPHGASRMSMHAHCTPRDTPLTPADAHCAVELAPLLVPEADHLLDHLLALQAVELQR